MSGEESGTGSPDWHYAHILWQRHGLRMEEFAEMPRNLQLAYIASEQLERENPARAEGRIAKWLLERK